VGKASSAKKVARAARAGSAVKGRERRELGFPAGVFLILVLGTLLVVYARADRGAASSPTLEQHWHAALGVYDCTGAADAKFLPTIENNGLDPNGIHTHGDGIIHIHPFNSSAAGKNARMGVFFDTVGIKVDGTKSITLPSGTVLTAGTDCGGKPAVLEIVRFDADNASKAGEVITTDFAKIRFLKDREAFTIALVPEGTEVPRPPTIPALDALTDLNTASSPSATTTIVPAAGSPATTVPGATTAPADGSTATTVGGSPVTTVGGSPATTVPASTASSTTTK
jgi:hypothetical protein